MGTRRLSTWLYLLTKRKLNLSGYSLLQANEANSSVILGIDEKSDQAQRDCLLATLPCVDAAAFNSYDHQYERKCLPDTRVDLICLVTELADSSFLPTSIKATCRVNLGSSRMESLGLAED
jgi:hypothetical protein